MRFEKPCFALLALGIVFSASSGCSDAEMPNDAPNEGVPRAAASLRWVSLHEFGRISGLAVDSRGSVLVGDPVAGSVVRLTPEGEFDSSMGRRGSGPGEFRGLRDVQVGPGDSVFALDSQANRITVWAPDDPASAAYSVDLTTTDGSTASNNLLKLGSGDLGVQFTGVFTDGTLEDERAISLRRLQYTPGAMRPELQTLLVVPDREVFVSRDVRYGFAAGPMPYGRESLLRSGPQGEIYFARTDSSAIMRLDPGGRLRMVVQLEAGPIRVTDRDIQMLISSYAGDPIPMELMEAAWQQGEVPLVKPRIRDFLVDDSGQLWVRPVGPQDVHVNEPFIGLVYRRKGASTTMPPFDEWLVFDPEEGTLLAIIEVPHAVELQEVLGDGLYGYERGEHGVTRVVRYDVESPAVR